MSIAVTLEDIKAARATLDDEILGTPCTFSKALSDLSGCKVYLKMENLQLTGSYKVRGSQCKLRALSEDQKKQGVIAVSAGNHAQGVAYNAAQLGIRAHIVMPRNAPQIKISSTQALGAEVVLHGDDFEQACEKALELQRAKNLVFVHPYDDPKTIAGQGTIGLELLEQLPGLTHVVVPIGGGGLVSGVACALKESGAAVKVIGAQVNRSNSIADGIAMKAAGQGRYTRPMIARYVDELFTISEESIAEAILILMEQCKTVVEGAAATALATLLHHLQPSRDWRCALVLTGGNIDMHAISHVLGHALKQSGRLMRLRISLPDHPGSLGQLTRFIGSLSANILQVSHDRSNSAIPLGRTEVAFSLETRGPDHIRELQQQLRQAGYLLLED